MSIDAVLVNFTTNGNSEKVNLPTKFKDYLHIKFGYLTYVLNYKNVDTIFSNTRLYLNTAGTTFIDLIPGLYDINSLNSGVLSPVIGGLYYKI